MFDSEFASAAWVDREGYRLAYFLEGAGPPVLFIQGTGLHGAGWRPQTVALRDRFACLTFDNRGMDRSLPPPASLTVAALAEDAAAVMMAAGWESAHVVGHSLGGLIALQLALDHRPRVRSLALLCTFADGAEATKLTLWMLWVGLRTRVGSRAARRRAFLQMVLTPREFAKADHAALAAKLEPYFGHDLADQPPVVMAQLRAMADCDLTARLGELAGLPTLVVSAREDRIAPLAAGRCIAAGIPGARFWELPDAAHGVPLTAPNRINPLLSGHLTQASAKVRS